MHSIRKVDDDAIPPLSAKQRRTLTKHVDTLHQTVSDYPEETIRKAHRSGLWLETQDWISGAVSSTFGIFSVLAACEPRHHAIDDARERTRTAYESMLSLAFWTDGNPQSEDFEAAKDALVACRDACRGLVDAF